MITLVGTIICGVASVASASCALFFYREWKNDGHTFNKDIAIDALIVSVLSGTSAGILYLI